MVANIVIGCDVASGRDSEARGVLRDFATYLEGFGAQVRLYRALYVGELSGRVNILRRGGHRVAHRMIDGLITDGANNPLEKAWTQRLRHSRRRRVLSPSIEPDLPMLPLSPVRGFRGFVAAAGGAPRSSRRCTMLGLAPKVSESRRRVCD